MNRFMTWLRWGPKDSPSWYMSMSAKQTFPRLFHVVSWLKDKKISFVIVIKKQLQFCYVMQCHNFISLAWQFQWSEASRPLPFEPGYIHGKNINTTLNFKKLPLLREDSMWQWVLTNVVTSCSQCHQFKILWLSL